MQSSIYAPKIRSTQLRPRLRMRRALQAEPVHYVEIRGNRCVCARCLPNPDASFAEVDGAHFAAE